MHPDPFDDVRVINEKTARELVDLSPRTWDRLRAAGDTPPITKISARRIGYRISDIKKWLDARRITPEARPASKLDYAFLTRLKQEVVTAETLRDANALITAALPELTAKFDPHEREDRLGELQDILRERFG